MVVVLIVFAIALPFTLLHLILLPQYVEELVFLQPNHGTFIPHTLHCLEIHPGIVLVLITEVGWHSNNMKGLHVDPNFVTLYGKHPEYPGGKGPTC